MSVIVDQLGTGAFELTVEGTVEKQDYAHFKPILESSIEIRGEVQLLVHLPGKLQITPGAFWEDLKFSASHYGDIHRLAIVCDDASKSWLATIARPFTRADVRFFPSSELDTARDWIAAAGTSNT